MNDIYCMGRYVIGGEPEQLWFKETQFTAQEVADQIGAPLGIIASDEEQQWAVDQIIECTNERSVSIMNREYKILVISPGHPLYPL